MTPHLLRRVSTIIVAAMSVAALLCLSGCGFLTLTWGHYDVLLDRQVETIRGESEEREIEAPSLMAREVTIGAAGVSGQLVRAGVCQTTRTDVEVTTARHRTRPFINNKAVDSGTVWLFTGIDLAIAAGAGTFGAVCVAEGPEVCQFGSPDISPGLTGGIFLAFASMFAVAGLIDLGQLTYIPLSTSTDVHREDKPFETPARACHGAPAAGERFQLVAGDSSMTFNTDRNGRFTVPLPTVVGEDPRNAIAAMRVESDKESTKLTLDFAVEKSATLFLERELKERRQRDADAEAARVAAEQTAKAEAACRSIGAERVDAGPVLHVRPSGARVRASANREASAIAPLAKDVKVTALCTTNEWLVAWASDARETLGFIPRSELETTDERASRLLGEASASRSRGELGEAVFALHAVQAAGVLALEKALQREVARTSDALLKRAAVERGRGRIDEAKSALHDLERIGVDDTPAVERERQAIRRAEERAEVARLQREGFDRPEEFAPTRGVSVWVYRYRGGIRMSIRRITALQDGTDGYVAQQRTETGSSLLGNVEVTIGVRRGNDGVTKFTQNLDHSVHVEQLLAFPLRVGASWRRDAHVRCKVLGPTSHGQFTECVEIEIRMEGQKIEPPEVWCRGVGLVRDPTMELESYR